VGLFYNAPEPTRSYTSSNSADRNLQQGKEVEERHDVSHEPISPDATRLKVSRYQGDKNDHFTFLILKNTLVSVESHEEETSRKDMRVNCRNTHKYAPLCPSIHSRRKSLYTVVQKRCPAVS